MFAESLLQSKPKWQQEEFMDAWLNSIPQVTFGLTKLTNPPQKCAVLQMNVNLPEDFLLCFLSAGMALALSGRHCLEAGISA